MNEKIYLGFAGKDNIRLGESLMLIKRYHKDINMNIGYNILNIDALDKYLSNVYLMYNIKNSNDLMAIINICTNGRICAVSIFDESKRNIFLNNQKETDYIIPFDTFIFFSEKMWPQIVKAFLNNLSKNLNYFTLRMNIPLEKIQNMSRGKDLGDSSMRFQQDVTKWLNFQLIGNIERVEYQNESLILTIKVIY